MDTARILICISNDSTLNKIKNLLLANNLIIVDQAKDGQECLKKCKIVKPDIVLIEYNLNMVNGLEITKIIVKNKISNVILILPEEKICELEDIRTKFGFTFIVKPISKNGLLSTIEYMVKANNKVNLLEKEINKLKNTLETRKEIEKAKGLLMRSLNLTEAEAFKKIQKQSMDKGLPMINIAKAIIIAYDI